MTKATFYHPPIANIPLLTVPLAYLHLATALKASPHTLELVDGRLEADPIPALLRSLENSDLMLVSAMPGSQIASALQACAAAREAFPELPIFWGGPHPSVDPESTIASELVSGVVVGRGEFTIAELLDSRGDAEAASLVPNLLVKRRDGTILRTPRVRFSNRPPTPPDFRLLDDIEPYVCQTRRSERMIDYISSFGCPHHCTFCSEPVTSGGNWSCMDAETLVEAVIELQELYGIDGILFQDAKFVTDKVRLARFCSLLIEREVQINWMATMCSTDVARFEKEGILDLMHRSGCEQVFIGAEAASPEILKQYRKTVKADGTFQIARLLWEEYDILPHFSYIIGYPIESLEQVAATLALHFAICELVGFPTGELGLYNPVANTPFAAANAHHFHMPETLQEWSLYSYTAQTLYAKPSREVDRALFQQYVKLRRRFPKIDHRKTYDVWQRQVEPT